MEHKKADLIIEKYVSYEDLMRRVGVYLQKYGVKETIIVGIRKNYNDFLLYMSGVGRYPFKKEHVICDAFYTFREEKFKCRKKLSKTKSLKP